MKVSCSNIIARLRGDGQVADENSVARLVGQLDLADKVLLLTGSGAWSTAALPGIGLRPMVLSDGPSGVRGELWDERSPSLLLPSSTALAASWDIDLARRFGSVAAVDARRKGVDVILGPTVALHRSPLGGRNFESFSEDPLLTADLAAAYVTGVQANGVAAAIKAYVANDSETDRYRLDVHVAERVLREVYLLPFERAVIDADVWVVMSAYNAVNGVTMTENPLLDSPLDREWGFAGVVVGDWTAVRSIESARHAQHLAMPGPGGPWGPALVEAVRRGEVAESAIDDKVERILRLAVRVGALTGFSPSPVIEREDGPAFARLAAAQGMVLVRNEGALPLPLEALSRVAVIGEHARRGVGQGGGSATVKPAYVVSPLAGLRAALPDGVEIDYRLGAVTNNSFSELDPDRMRNPDTGGAGAQLRFFDADGRLLHTEQRYASEIVEFGHRPFAPSIASLTFSTIYTPEEGGVLQVGFASPGHGRMRVDGQLRLDEVISAVGVDQVGGFFDPPSVTAAIDVVADEPIALEYEFTAGEIVDGVEGSFSVIFGVQPGPGDASALIDDAVAAARNADVAVVVVGTNAHIECEGYDRSDLRLPGHQDELVAAVAAVNPNTVVVVNAGAPVELPWRNDVTAVLLTWFGGQEYGHALADVLLGHVEPGGRLPTTWPKTLVDAPVANVVPNDSVLHYDEGLHVGYRAWSRVDREPAYPFGFGLGYTSWQLGPAVAEPAVHGVRVTLDVTNVGARPGKQVVQVYAARPDSRVERPERWLVGYGVVWAEPGTTQTLQLDIAQRAFAYWDQGWVHEPGEYLLFVGPSIAAAVSPIRVQL